MTREKYESLPLATLKELAKARKMKGISGLKKSDLIDAMLALDEQEAQKEAPAEEKEAKSVKEAKEGKETKAKREKKTEKAEKEEKREEKKDREEKREGRADRHDRRDDREKDHDKDKEETDIEQLDSGYTANGILEVLQDGYGFIRCENYLPGENDVYVSPSQIRRFGLKTGDILTGNTRIKTQGEKFSALLYVSAINGLRPAEAMKRKNFEDLTPIFPNKRIRLETPGCTTAMRIVDLVSPIGKGQRGMIVSPPKAGKTTLLKEVALSVQKREPDMHLLILLIDERPEEVTDIREAIAGPNVEVIYSTFDELPEHHKRVSEMVIARAKRLVEHGKDVMILLDSITRLARAYNLTVPPSGRTLSGGLDPAALYSPKRFFGAARNMREGGSLTILATALVDTGSKMDDVVYEEFKGTGNMELMLDRKLQEKRVFPAIDIPKSGTRRDDLLLTREEQEAADIMRRAMNGMKAEEAVDNLLNMFARTKTNAELVHQIIRQKFI
ncbi:transcription termination factor Rho [Lachnoclostridium sp. An169]|uniref:transcription termination factor Rho n=1 Tax=Lachnoclostridium sp. An169 TaxID=1965569 RepID=UPI000B38C4F6|nr:transcription termination factor Rho [Lachnoclostridium sp. An169]OUP85380.1 transcription termination factor Rho [Lachnoclostridium sp. An169]HJA67691.1 transcription termination factor Rho [Candidatus Mediterraneibacter cottocaccae]